MGFTIDMISGEIQDDSSSNIDNSVSINEPTADMLDAYQPMPRIQEYIPEEVPHQIPESIIDIDIDTFIDRM